jgi:aspartate/methionine/tyrosine aminotransferase
MSPANPTGTVIPADLMGAVVQWCAKRGVRLLSDEIYQDLDYTGQAVSALQFTDEAIVIHSFSKYYAMTGWRLGWMVLPASLTRAFERVQQNLFICPPALAQRAALAAFEGQEEMDAVRATYQRNRDQLLDALPSLGFGPLLPADGAFYIYAGLSASDPDSLAFCERLLDEAHIAITPGVDFDEERGTRFVRISYCCSETKISAVIERLKAWRASGQALAQAS